MAFSNSSPYFRPVNIRSLSSYIEESYAENAPPCCMAYLAGGGHDWTCRISGNALYINYEQFNRPSQRSSTDESVRSASSVPLLLAQGAPPEYSAIPRENELPFREFPPAYDQLIRADRFQCVGRLPGCSRLVHPPARALNEAELAAMGVYIGLPPARLTIVQVCVAKLKGDLSWIMIPIIALSFLLAFLLSKFT